MLVGSGADELSKKFFGAVMHDTNGVPKKIRIKIRRDVMEVLETIPKVIPIEVSGMGKFEGDPRDGMLTKLYLPKNSVSQATFTRIDGGNWAMMLDKLEEDGEDATECARVWWHSHCNMGCNPSSLDLQTMCAPAEDKEEGRLEWTLNIITAIGDIKGWLIIFKPILYIFEVEFQVEGVLSDEKAMTPEALQVYLHTFGILLERLRQGELGDNVLLLHRMKAACEDELKDIVKKTVAEKLPSEVNTARMRNLALRESRMAEIRAAHPTALPSLSDFHSKPDEGEEEMWKHYHEDQNQQGTTDDMFPMRETVDRTFYGITERESIMAESHDNPLYIPYFPFEKFTFNSDFLPADQNWFKYCPSCEVVVPLEEHLILPVTEWVVPYSKFFCPNCEEPLLTAEEIKSIASDDEPIAFCTECWSYNIIAQEAQRMGCRMCKTILSRFNQERNVNV